MASIIMHVLFVDLHARQESYAKSGVQRYNQWLDAQLGKRIEYVHIPSSNDMVKSAEGGPADLSLSVRSRSRFFRCLYAIRLLAGYFKETFRLLLMLRKVSPNVDIIHVNRIGCEVDAIAARLAFLGPVIGTVHNLPGLDERARHPVRRFVEWLSLRSAHHLIAVSKQTRDEWVERTGVSASKFTIIYNGMDPPVNLPSIEEARKRFDVPADVFCVGICARLHRMKGHGVLFNALSALKETEDRRLKTEEPSSQRKLMLLVAGEGPLEEHLKQQVTDLELEDSVRFLGHVKDPLVFLRAVDVQVLPSVELECLPYSIVEGMHCEVPSIVSDVGGSKEIIGASGGGSVVPAADVTALARSIMAYSQDRERCVREGLLAQRFAQDHLTATIMAEKTLEVYQSAGKN